MKRYPNAQDGIEKGSFVFGNKTTFREAYPQVVSLQVEITALPLGFGKAETDLYTLDRPPGQVSPCPNPQCSEGGFDVGSFLYHLIRESKTEGVSGGGCVGEERLGRGRRSCFYSFSAKAAIGYAVAEEL
ncbi:MAG: hypothetical protein H7Y36_07020 [Armatimonadetes bacterium]|nr:hypothetical protein [Akkermansiaceae bacterium]